MALTALRAVKAILHDETTAPDAVDDPQLQGDPVTSNSELEEAVEKVVEMMQSRVDAQALSFSGVNSEQLSKLNIEERGELVMKSDNEERALASDSLRGAKLWSAELLYSHLNFLHELIPKANEAAARTWIDAFFFRAAEMSPPGKRLVLSLEQSVPPTAMAPFKFTTAGGSIDYAATMANETDAKAFLRRPILENLTKHSHTLFVSEAKSRGVSLEGHLPQAICEMYACAKQLQKNIIRGALTSGHDWIFLLLKMNDDGNGGIFAQSEIVTVRTPKVSGGVSSVMCSTIAGILAHWTTHSNEEIEADDWFTISWA